MCTTIDIIAKEEVVVALNIAVVVGVAPEVEEPHQVLVLTVDISENFDGSIDAEHHRLILQNANALISKRQNVLTSECEVSITIILSGPISRTQKVR